MIKKLLAILSCVVLVTSFSACVEKNSDSEINKAEKTPATSSEEKTEATTTQATSAEKKQAEVKISITPPDGWTAVEGSVLPVQYMKNTASFMVKEEKFGIEDLDEIMTKAKDAFESTFDNVAYLSETETLTVGGFDARKMFFTCEVSKLKMKFEYVYVNVNGKTFAITFGDLESTFDSLSADYDKILSDITFQ